jgi:8-oxo-dGTP pyrophosphatase MutT (NUDIX family)
MLDMNKHNNRVLRKIRDYVEYHNNHAKSACKPQFAVNVVIQGDKLQVCRGRSYMKPNNRYARCELQNSGGSIEENETPKQAGIRELKEETWDDLPESVKENYKFPLLLFTQKIYFGNSTVIFIHKVPACHKLYEGNIPQPEIETKGSGEIEHIELVPISEVYRSLRTGYNGVKWRRCSAWSLAKLKHLLELYTQIII